MLILTPVLYRVEESSIMIEQINPGVFVVKEENRYLNDHIEWGNSPTLFSLESATKVVEEYFEGLQG